MSLYEFLRSAPYLRLLIPFITGILLAPFLILPVWLCFLLVAIFVALLMLLQILKALVNYRKRWIWGVLLNLILILLAALFAKLNSRIETLPENKVIVSGVVLENPKINAATFRTIVKINAIYENNIWRKANSKVVFSLEKKAKVPVLDERILIQASFKKIRNFGNPYEFDYKAYMNRNDIYYTAFADSLNWFVTGESTRFSLTLYALKLRDKLLNSYRQLHLTPSSFAVISALTVGDKRYLDEEIKSAYVNSGTMHLLAVSGMHVALLFWLLQQIFKPLSFTKRGKKVSAVLILLFIWMYAFITGLTPSVVRASVMFSFWIVGDSINRNVNIYNTISASALLLLLIDPDTLFDIGFQLSYLAVLGIVVLYKDILNWFYIKNKILKDTWGMIAVSLAAQTFTLPVTLYHFHQFPNYFLLANVIALPLSTFILYGSIFAQFIAHVKFLWAPVGWLLKTSVGWMNDPLIWIEHLPYSVTKGIWISGFMAVLLFIVILFLRFYIVSRRAVFVYVIGICCVLFSANIFIKRLNLARADEIVIYNSPKFITIQFSDPNRNYWVTNDILNSERLQKPVAEHTSRKFENVYFNSGKAVEDRDLLVYKNFIFYGKKRFYIWENRPEFKKYPVDIDFLIIHDFKRKDLNAIQKYFTPKEIIITSNVFDAYASELKRHFDVVNIPCSVVKTDGAWILAGTKKNVK